MDFYVMENMSGPQESISTGVAYLEPPNSILVAKIRKLLN